jgi:AhpD family alkylhydroperoxidase
MAWLEPLTVEQMTLQQRRTFERAMARLGVEGDEPLWLRILANSPDFLRDVSLSLQRVVFADGELEATTKLLLAIAAAAQCGHGEVARFFADRAVAAGLTMERIYDAVGLSATTTSYNGYYGFRAMAGSKAFDGFHSGLRGSLRLKPDQDRAFVELLNLTTSAQNGCSCCVSDHVTGASEAGVRDAQIDEAIRTSAIVQAICHFVGSSSF